MQWEDKGSTNGSSYNWHKQNPTFWKQFYEQMPSMQQIYFAGGESLIIEEHYEILEHAIKMDYAKDLELRYNSNGVEWRDDLFDLWKEFKLVRFHYSIDSIKEMNDYIRYPSDWENQVNTFHRLDNETSDNVEVTIACAVQALNVYYLPDFIQWKLEQGFKKINMWPFGAGGISQHFVYWPAHLNVKSLPTDFKAKCRAKYEAWYSWWEANWELGIPSWHKGKVDYEQWRTAEYGIKRLNGILSFMESEDWSQRLPEMKEFLGLCDKQRGITFEETFPEMIEIFKDIE
jgi:sulfatase maturation enzyme AslB (radical SAM superfamily)